MGITERKGESFLIPLNILSSLAKLGVKVAGNQWGYIQTSLPAPQYNCTYKSFCVSTLNIVKNIFLNQLFTSNVYRDFAFAADP